MKNCQLADSQLIQNYLKGCNRSFKVLLERHRKKVFASILYAVGNREIAEDILQDTFARCIEVLHGGQYVDQGKFQGWLVKIARNICLDHFRERSRLKVYPLPDNIDIVDLVDESINGNPLNKIVGEEYSIIVKEKIEHLPFEQRQVLVLRHYADLSFKDIASITGVNVNTALGRMRYALDGLKKQIVNNGINNTKVANNIPRL